MSFKSLLLILTATTGLLFSSVSLAHESKHTCNPSGQCDDVVIKNVHPGETIITILQCQSPYQYFYSDNVSIDYSAKTMRCHGFAKRGLSSHSAFTFCSNTSAVRSHSYTIHWSCSNVSPSSSPL